MSNQKLNISDADLLKTCTGFTQGLLGKKSVYNMCFAVCSPLQGYLFSIGIESQLTYGFVVDGQDGLTEHYWLTLPDDRILDPTICQFERFQQKPDANTIIVKSRHDSWWVYLGQRPEWFYFDVDNLSDNKKLTSDLAVTLVMSSIMGPIADLTVGEIWTDDDITIKRIAEQQYQYHGSPTAEQEYGTMEEIESKLRRDLTPG